MDADLESGETVLSVRIAVRGALIRVRLHQHGFRIHRYVKSK